LYVEFFIFSEISCLQLIKFCLVSCTVTPLWQGGLSLYSAALARAVVAWLVFFPPATFILYYIFLFTLRPFMLNQQKAVA
jgi:hypothetical protein